MKRGSTWLGMVLALAAGCGDGEGDPAGPDAAGIPAANTVAGTVDYRGAEDGALIIGVFTEFPPMSGPVAFHTEPQPSWPVTFELPSIDPGTYYLVATLDVGRDNPTSPGPEDLQAASEPITISDSAGAWVELTLVDP
jgi:hypothetical protein